MNNEKSVLLNDPDQLNHLEYNGEDWVPEADEWNIMKDLSGFRFDHMLDLVLDQFEASFASEGTTHA